MNWIFCAMAQTLAITAKVTSLGGKKGKATPLSGKADIALVLLGTEGWKKQKG